MKRTNIKEEFYNEDENSFNFIGVWAYSSGVKPMVNYRAAVPVERGGLRWNH